ncbi:MAG: nickel pincer cofactor biosynthesis protein LarC [Phycisphaerae bacterium]|nr:nickel pincer cofactor biosynthesis protein LarC [Phycisphaerae bacterium]
MTCLYFDCFAGAAGDMIVGALLDLGVSFDAFRAELAKLPIEGVSLRLEDVQRRGLAGKKFHVDVPNGDQPHRHLSDILELIEEANLPARAARWAKDIFTRLAQAEAQVHNIPIEKVHFHEVGAVDSIVDIVGAAVAMDLLDVEQVYCSPIPLGSGTVECEHGVIPVPAPATARLLAGAATVPGEADGELTTPTAAAVLTTLSETFGPPPAMEISAVGYGAGSRQFEKLPNLLRVFLGRLSEDGAADSIVEVSANIDDCTGELLGAAIEKLLAAGCVDAWATPVFTKKSRPAWVLSALCRPGDVKAIEQMFFTETTTFGVRRRACGRTKLLREFVTVETPYGPIRMKVGKRDGRVITAKPEFADAQAAAESHGQSIRTVLAAAEHAYRETCGA